MMTRLEAQGGLIDVRTGKGGGRRCYRGEGGGVTRGCYRGGGVTWGGYRGEVLQLLMFMLALEA